MSWPQNGRKNVLVLIVELRKIVVQVVNTICVKTSLITLIIYPPKKGQEKNPNKVSCLLKDIFEIVINFDERDIKHQCSITSYVTTCETLNVL